MNEVNHKQGPCWNMFEISIAFLNENQMDTYRVLHKWQNEVTTSKTVIFQHFKHNNMTILHNILGDLLY